MKYFFPAFRFSEELWSYCLHLSYIFTQPYNDAGNNLFQVNSNKTRDAYVLQ